MTDTTGSPGSTESRATAARVASPPAVDRLYHHVPHPRIATRRTQRPAKASDAHPVGFNGRVAVLLTRGVGTMVCAYVFAVLAVLGFPGLTISLSSIAFTTSGVTAQQYVQWVSQTFIQLVMLAVIMVGQNILSRAADLRSEQTYSDAEAILHECLELQAHLTAQDVALKEALESLSTLRSSRGAALP